VRIASAGNGNGIGGVHDASEGDGALVGVGGTRDVDGMRIVGGRVGTDDDGMRDVGVCAQTGGVRGGGAIRVLVPVFGLSVVVWGVMMMALVMELMVCVVLGLVPVV
jgi:hypothetical protein